MIEFTGLTRRKVASNLFCHQETIAELLSSSVRFNIINIRLKIILTFICVLLLDVRNPFSVCVFEDHVYWSTQEKGEVFRQDKFGHGIKTKLLTAGPWLTQVSVYQQQRYNSVASKQHTFQHINTTINCHTLVFVFFDFYLIKHCIQKVYQLCMSRL